MKNARRIEIGMAILVLFGFVSNVTSVHDAASTLHKLPPDSDIVTQFGARITPIRHDLPRSGIVGFISEPPEEMNTNPVYTREFVFLRYFLAPLLVLPYAHQPLVIGSFHGGSPKQLLDKQGLTVVKDYGNGIMLLRSAR